MAQLEQILERLQSALAHLEQIVETKATGMGSDDSELRAALKAAQNENTDLQKAATTVAARLDKTIVHLQTTLEA